MPLINRIAKALFGAPRFEKRDASCSFCRRSYHQVGPLVEGPGEVFICGACIALCRSILDREAQRRGLHLNNN